MSGFSPFSSLKDYTGCGIYGIDRLPLAELVEEEFGSDATIAHARAMVGICYCECGGKSSPPVIGDTSLTVGPAIGPLQVTRATAKDLGLVPQDETFEAYKQRAMNEEWCLRAGVKVFASKLLSAKGDFADAIRRYNGSGSKAVQYRDKALSFLAEKFGSNWQSA